MSKKRKRSGSSRASRRSGSQRKVVFTWQTAHQLILDWCASQSVPFTWQAARDIILRWTKATSKV